jgi:hypothetical protein
MDNGTICFLVVVGVVALWLYSRGEKRRDEAVNKFKTRCGECEFTSAWLPESAAQDAMIDHYAAEHPGTPPGGLIQFR